MLREISIGSPSSGENPSLYLVHSTPPEPALHAIEKVLPDMAGVDALLTSSTRRSPRPLPKHIQQNSGCKFKCHRIADSADGFSNPRRNQKRNIHFATEH